MQENLIELIDRASKAAGNDSKLAKLIDANQQHISQWRTGKRPCPPGDVALMAEIAGLDPDTWALRAVAAKYEGTEKGEKLKRVLKALAATGAAVLSSGVNAATIGYNQLAEMVNYLRCIKSKVRKRPVRRSRYKRKR